MGAQQATAPEERSRLSNGGAQPASSLRMRSVRVLRVGQSCEGSAARALDRESCQQLAGNAHMRIAVHED